MDKKYLISWNVMDAAEESTCMVDTDEEAEERIAGLVAHNEKNVTLWKQVPYEVVVKLFKKSDKS